MNRKHNSLISKPKSDFENGRSMWPFEISSFWIVVKSSETTSFCSINALWLTEWKKNNRDTHTRRNNDRKLWIFQKVCFVWNLSPTSAIAAAKHTLACVTASFNEVFFPYFVSFIFFPFINLNQNQRTKMESQNGQKWNLFKQFQHRDLKCSLKICWSRKIVSESCSHV